MIAGAAEFMIARPRIFDADDFRYFARSRYLRPLAIRHHHAARFSHRDQPWIHESRGAHKRQQALRVGRTPVVVLTAELRGFVELEDRTVFRARRLVDHQRVHAQDVGTYFAQTFERQQGVFQMVQDAEEQDDIEIADLLDRKSVV